MARSVVKSCLPEFSDFTQVFSRVKVLCNRPQVYLSQCFSSLFNLHDEIARLPFSKHFPML